MISSTLLAIIAAFGGERPAAALPASALPDSRAATTDLAQEGSPAETRTVEIRSYNLKPGMHERFRQLFLKEAFPLLQRAQIDVVAFGRSMHHADSWFLIRSFSSVDERQRSEDAFYGSREWLDGPRAAVLDCIESYTTVVVELDRQTIEGLRNTVAGSGQ